MTGYIILGAFVVLVISHTVVFFMGSRKGRKAAEAEFDEELKRKTRNEIEFEREKSEIMGEVFGDAEQKKASLSGGAARERFERIDDVLRGKPAH